MTHLVYDNSFEGFLTAIFITFSHRYQEVIISPQSSYLPTLFGEEVTIYTDLAQAKRVLTKIETTWGREGVSIFLKAFLSQEEKIENALLEAIQMMVKYPKENVLQNFANEAIVRIHNASKSVGREVHRLKEFIRFDKVGNLYFAKISPQYEVLPLVVPHFKARFSDQEWVLYDVQRQYGFHYDLSEVVAFTPEHKDFGKLAQDSDNYQALWKTYFQHINISERKNKRLQLQLMPKRYWEYLPEVSKR